MSPAYDFSLLQSTGLVEAGDENSDIQQGFI